MSITVNDILSIMSDNTTHAEMTKLALSALFISRVSMSPASTDLFIPEFRELMSSIDAVYGTSFDHMASETDYTRLIREYHQFGTLPTYILDIPNTDSCLLRGDKRQLYRVMALLVSAGGEAAVEEKAPLLGLVNALNKLGNIECPI